MQQSITDISKQAQTDTLKGHKYLVHSPDTQHYARYHAKVNPIDESPFSLINKKATKLYLEGTETQASVFLLKYLFCLILTQRKAIKAEGIQFYCLFCFCFFGFFGGYWGSNIAYFKLLHVNLLKTGILFI